MISEPVAVTKCVDQNVLKLKKKRGKYVEKKSSKISAYSKASSRARSMLKTPNSSPKACSPKRAPVVPPRPSPTSFVNSVFDILTKTTNQPQHTEKHPDDTESIVKAELTSVPEVKVKEKKKMTNRIRKFELHPEKTRKEHSPIGSPKKRFKSKVLNAEHNKPPPKKDVVVLQPKKQVHLVPSACSSFSRDGLSWMSYSDDEVFINKEITIEKPPDIDYENNQVVKEINEGKKLNEEKSKQENMEKGPDKDIYNFFVDVLHTIKPDYQLKTQCQLKDSTDDLKNLEIDEKVANKLAFAQKTIKKVNIFGIDDELSDSPTEHFEIPNFIPKRPIISHEPAKLSRKSNSFAHPKPKPPSVSFRRPSGSKKSQKQRFLAMLKQKLLSNIEKQPHPEEPRSIYEALKIMAKNKAPAPRVRFQKNTRRLRDATIRKPKQSKEECDVRYPIEAEVDSRYAKMYYSPESLGSLQVYGEDYMNQSDLEIESNTSDLCNRFSIASFFADGNARSKSPVSVIRRTTGNRSTSPFSGRSSRL